MVTKKQVEEELEAISTDIVVKPLEGIRAVDDMDLAEYEAWLETEGVELVDVEGSKWRLIKDKDSLINVPFIIAKVRFNEGKLGGFASVCCYLENKEKIIFNDGGSGVYATLRAYEAKGRTSGIRCLGGLRVSRYDKELDDGKVIAAQTYYLSADAA
jgi:hypothetical protein